MTEYIEREALIEELEKLRMSETLSKHATYELCAITQDAISRAQIVVAGLPAADVAPVVHGRWEEVDWIEPDDSNTEIIRFPKAALRCSHCKFAFKKELLWRNKYCPSCGARMDGADLGEPKGKTETEREAFDFLRRRFNRKE